MIHDRCDNYKLSYFSSIRELLIMETVAKQLYRDTKILHKLYCFKFSLSKKRHRRLRINNFLPITVDYISSKE